MIGNYISWEMTPTSIGGEKQACISGGVNPQADIASGILELINLSMNDNTIILIVHGLRKFEKSRYERSVLDTAKPRGCVSGGASCAVIVI